MAWLVVNLFLFVMILVGAGALWLLGSVVQSLELAPIIEQTLLGLSGIAAIMVSYYTGKLMHHVAERRRKHRPG